MMIALGETMELHHQRRPLASLLNTNLIHLSSLPVVRLITLHCRRVGYQCCISCLLAPYIFFYLHAFYFVAFYLLHQVLYNITTCPGNDQRKKKTNPFHVRLSMNLACLTLFWTRTCFSMANWYKSLLRLMLRHCYLVRSLEKTNSLEKHAFKSHFILQKSIQKAKTPGEEVPCRMR